MSDSPSAEEGNIPGYYDRHMVFHRGTAVTHTRTSTDLGPDFCCECSAAWQDWVVWPCGEEG